MREVDFARGMSVWIDAHQASKPQCSLVPAPIEIEPPGIGVNFNRNAILSAGREHTLNIEFVSRPPQELSAGHVAEYGGVRIGDRPNDALGLCIAVKFKASMDAGDDKVECIQNLRIKVQCGRRDRTFC